MVVAVLAWIPVRQSELAGTYEEAVEIPEIIKTPLITGKRSFSETDSAIFRAKLGDFVGGAAVGTSVTGAARRVCIGAKTSKG